jgi:hypothetical protein
VAHSIQGFLKASHLYASSHVSYPTPSLSLSNPCGYRPGHLEARVRRVPAVVEIAELLGVTKQRAHQLAAEPGFTAPLAEDGCGRLWGRGEV